MLRVTKLIHKIKSSLPNLQGQSAKAQLEYREDIKEAQAYLVLLKKLAGCEKQFTWNKKRIVYRCAEELMTEAASDLIKATQLPQGDEPMEQLTWKQNVSEMQRAFKSMKVLFDYIIERLRIRKNI